MCDYETSASLIMMLVCVGLILAIALGVNACSAEDWNNGTCPKCRVRYELRAVNDGLRYYSCPKCGQEVQRFGS